MNLTWIAMFFTIVLLVGMLLAFEGGRRLGIARCSKEPDGLTKGAGPAEGAVFALLGLLIAFTFSGAADRFEARRALINTEANAIGTAWLRIDLLNPEAQEPLREKFRRYADHRATVYRDVSDIASVNAKLAEGAAMQREIWSEAVAACRLPGTPSQATQLLLSALNEMIDITGTRVMASQNHPPAVIFVLLVVLSLCASLLVGYGTSTNRDRSWFYKVTFALVISLAAYVIVDLEFPRLGFIRIDAADQMLIDLAASLH